MQRRPLIAWVMLTIVLFLWVLIGPSYAQSPELQRQMWACAVRVDNWQGMTADSGSGVVVRVGGQAYVVTNHHVAAEKQGQLRITFYNGVQNTGDIVANDPTMDVCVIRPHGDVAVGAEPATYSPGSNCYAAAFGMGDLRFIPLGPKGPIQFGGDPFPVTTFAGSTVSGDSGGGIFNESGQVVGVIRGKLDEGTATGLTGPAFERMLGAKETPTGNCYIVNGQRVCGQQQPQIYYSRPAQQTFAPQYMAAQQQQQVQPTQPRPVTTPPVAAPPAPRPACNCASEWVSVKDRVTKLEASVDERFTKLDSDLSAKFAEIEARPGVAGPQGPAGRDATVDYEQLANEVAKRLTHSATVTLLDGTTKTQTKPLNVPLEFIQHSRGLK